MKLLLDENLSRRIVPFLQTAFPGSTQVTLLGLESASHCEERSDVAIQMLLNINTLFTNWIAALRSQ